MGRRKFGSDPLPGNGPWRILAECPAMLHNTVRAATRGAREHRCICPRALALAEIDRDDRLSRKNSSGRKLTPAASYLNNVAEAASWPDLKGGLCQTAGGRRIVDAYASEVKVTGAAMAHRRMCSTCPVQRKCGIGVLKAEQPPGAWGGMYAGMSAADRKKVMGDA